MIRDYSVVILSGGQSRRMGQDKARLKIGSRRFVDIICQEFGDTHKVMLSVRSAKDFPEFDLPHITDRYPGCGPMSGLHSALAASLTPWVFVIPCDMPLIRRCVADRLFMMANEYGEDIDAVIPVETDGRLQVLCAIYHKRVCKIFQNMLDQQTYRMRDALERMRVLYVPVENFEAYDSMFRNINTMEDYKELTI